ncbi:MAG: S24/S26 family peptidase [Lachnospiraceae bacterium]|nr:S24/S26 family peptidase [Lachnospiraceae bacterium]
MDFKLSEYEDTIRMVLDSEGEFRIYPKGTSMLPLLKEGRDSVVLVKTEKFIKPWNIVFYKRDNGDFVLHRIVKVYRDEGLYDLCGDNHLMIEHGIRRDQIIGVVKRIYIGDYCVDSGNLFYKAYVSCWKSFFVRRVFYKVRYIFGKLFKKG